MAPYKITYFNAKGRAEAIRLILELNDQSYEEEYVNDRWPEMKKALTESGKLAYGQVPLLECGGKSYVQSMAIIRYLGKKFNMMGKDAEEEYQINMIADGASDLRSEYYQSIYHGTDDDKKTFSETTCLKWLGFLENIKKAHKGPHCVGSTLSIADIVLFDVLDVMKAMRADSFSGFPSLLEFYNAFHALPKYQAYLNSPRYHK